jgi:DNA repair protein RadD
MIKLRPYQEAAVKALFRYWSNNKDEHPVIGAPTGAGKSYIIAAIIERTLRNWPDVNILVVSHVKEIVEQDAKAIRTLTGRDVGIYSSGLGEKSKKQVTVGGIQTLYRNAEEFSNVGFVIIDEAHTIPLEGSGMYRTFFAGVGKAKYLGLSATLFRLGGGYIYGEDKLFDGVAYDLTSKQHFSRLVKDGYLSKLKTIATKIELDTKTLRTQNGDFKMSDMSSQFDRGPITDGAIKEVIKHGADYKKWLIFAIDIEHAEHIAETLIRADIPTQVVHSKMEDDRDKILRNYKRGKYRALVNINVLTTGFDDPEIDLIVLLRPTKSPVLHVQMIGRGLRIAPNKEHCLVMDFGGNTERLGPIDSVEVKVRRKGKGGKPITKRCPVCDAIHHPAVRVCEFCNHEFDFKHGLQDASGSSVLSDNGIWYEVDDVQYHISSKANRPDSLLITYQSGLRFFRDWANIEHPGYAGHMGRHWVKFRGVEATTVKEAFENKDKLAKPKRIKVSAKGKYPSIDDYDF